jgi:hypothetical protein
MPLATVLQQSEVLIPGMFTGIESADSHDGGHGETCDVLSLSLRITRLVNSMVLLGMSSNRIRLLFQVSRPVSKDLLNDHLDRQSVALVFPNLLG